MTTDGGQHWVNDSKGLPDLPTWCLVVDPRTGNLFAGNDNGVWELVSGQTTWVRFGAGMPNVQVTALSINESLDILTAATHGRGVFTFYLDNEQASSGAVSAASGSSLWLGPVYLAGAASIGSYGEQTVSGEQTLQDDGQSAAQLTIAGTVQDLVSTLPFAGNLPAGFTTGDNFELTKLGLGDVILSGDNTYGGVTDVKAGGLVVDNTNALGGTANGTVVETGAALELETSVSGEAIQLSGDGIPFDGHNTGALHNISNNNTTTGNVLTGTITLAANTTIGVNSGSTLTIAAPGSITGATGFTLTKELTGTLILGAADTYAGNTNVNQGVLVLQNPTSLGTTGSAGFTTTVLDGAQLQLQGGITVAGQTLQLTGTGVFATGALLDSGGNDTWQGPVNFGDNPGFNPGTPLTGTVSVGVTNLSDTLIIAGALGMASALPTGLTKTGLGKLVLTTQASTSSPYTGSTFVNQGSLAIQNQGALGINANNEIQRITVYGTANTTGSFTVTFNGQTTAQFPGTETAKALQTALDAIEPGVTVSSLIITLPALSDIPTVTVFTLTFGGALAGQNQPQVIVTSGGGITTYVSTVAAGGSGALVSAGAALELDGDPTGVGASMNVSGETLGLNGNGDTIGTGSGVNAVQTLTFTGKPTAGTFTLQFNGQTTTAITYSTVAATLQANIAAALDNLSTINTGNISVSSSATAPTVTFQNALGQTPEPLLIASSALSGGTNPTLTVTTTTAGSAPALAGGALRNISGNNTWSGAITLETSSTISVNPNTKLTISGAVGDPAGPPVPPPSLTKAGTGTLAFPNSNTYSGETYINAGVLNIGNTTSLGTPLAMVQLVYIGGFSGSIRADLQWPDHRPPGLFRTCLHGAGRPGRSVIHWRRGRLGDGHPFQQALHRHLRGHPGQHEPIPANLDQHPGSGRPGGYVAGWQRQHRGGQRRFAAAPGQHHRVHRALDPQRHGIQK